MVWRATAWQAPLDLERGLGAFALLPRVLGRTMNADRDDAASPPPHELAAMRPAAPRDGGGKPQWYDPIP